MQTTICASGLGTSSAGSFSLQASSAFFARMMVLYNGELLPADAVRLPLPNRGLFLNDGFFETLIWAPDGPRYLPYHVARMRRAAAALALQLPASLATGPALTATLRQLADTVPEPLQRLRLQVWRSGGGLYTPTTTDVEWLVTQQPFQATNTPIVTCEFAETIRTHHSPFSFCKGPNSLTYVLAAHERQQRGLDELIILSEGGYVSETVAAAIGWIKQGRVYSPSEATGSVAGTRMANLRAVAVTLGLEWQQGLFFPEELLQAEAAFTANISGIRPVQSIAGHALSSMNHPLLQLLQKTEALQTCQQD